MEDNQMLERFRISLKTKYEEKSYNLPISFNLYDFLPEQSHNPGFSGKLYGKILIR